MSEELPDEANIDALVNKGCCERVAESVRMDALEV